MFSSLKKEEKLNIPDRYLLLEHCFIDFCVERLIFCEPSFESDPRVEDKHLYNMTT